VDSKMNSNAEVFYPKSNTQIYFPTENYSTNSRTEDSSSIHNEAALMQEDKWQVKGTSPNKKYEGSPQKQSSYGHWNKNPSPQKPQSPSKYSLAKASYISTRLEESEANNYKSAGVLAYRIKDNNIQVLLGSEPRIEGPHCLNLLGGKRDKEDVDAEYTGLREFIEESGHILTKHQASLYFAFRTKPEKVIWNAHGKYALFLHKLDAEHHDLPEKYNNLQSRGPSSEMDHLYWLDLKGLIIALQKNQELLAIGNQTVTLIPFLRTSLLVGHLVEKFFGFEDLNGINQISKAMEEHSIKEKSEN